MDDRDRNGQLIAAYVAVLQLTYLRFLLAVLKLRRWVLVTFYRLVLGVDHRPPARPSQAELRERYGR